MRLSLCLISLLLLQTGCFSDYDHDVPDTEANLEGFRRHFRFEPDQGVDGVFYYADELGADPLYQIGFNGDREVVSRIIDSLGLQPGDRTGISQVQGREFHWFRNSELSGMEIYSSVSSGGDLFRYLWYDPTSMRVRYLEYGM